MENTTPENENQVNDSVAQETEPQKPTTSKPRKSSRELLNEIKEFFYDGYDSVKDDVRQQYQEEVDEAIIRAEADAAAKEVAAYRAKEKVNRLRAQAGLPVDATYLTGMPPMAKLTDEQQAPQAPTSTSSYNMDARINQIRNKPSFDVDAFISENTNRTSDRDRKVASQNFSWNQPTTSQAEEQPVDIPEELFNDEESEPMPQEEPEQAEQEENVEETATPATTSNKTLKIVVPCVIVVAVLAVAFLAMHNSGDNKNKKTSTANISVASNEETTKEAEETKAGDAAETTAPVEETEAVTTTTTAVTLPVSIDEMHESVYPANMVVVGDSIASGYYLFDFIDENNNLATGDLGVHDIHEYSFSHDGQEMDYIDAIKEMQPAYILMSMGMNDVNMMTSDEYTEQYQTEIEAVLEVSPNSDIVVSSITPVSAGLEYFTSEQITTYNAALQTMVEGLNMDNVKFADVYSALADENGDLIADYPSGDDGIHLWIPAYEKMLEVIYPLFDEMPYHADLVTIPTDYDPDDPKYDESAEDRYYDEKDSEDDSSDDSSSDDDTSYDDTATDDSTYYGTEETTVAYYYDNSANNYTW